MVRGKEICGKGYVGGLERELRVIGEGREVEEMVGWMMGGLNDLSRRGCYLRWMMGKKKEYVLDGGVKGGEGEMMMWNE